MIEVIFVVVSLILLAIASYNDTKTKEVPDWISYSLITIGFSLSLLASIVNKDYKIILFSVIGFAIMYLIALVMYYTKQWGGGDAKLLMGLGTMFYYYPKFLLNYFHPSIENIPFIIIIFINLIIYGAIYSLIWTVFLSIKNKKHFKIRFKEIYNSPSTLTIRKIGVLMSIILSLFAVQEKNLLPLFILLSTFPVIFVYTFILMKTVELSSMIKRISIDRLTEGDWIIYDIHDKNKLIYSSKSTGVTKEQINKIKSLRIHSVTIKEGIPFVPSFLISLILSFIFGNPITLLI